MVSQYKKSGIVERRHQFAWCNREIITFVCQACLAVVPDPEQGCHHCKRKMDKKHDRLNAFLASKQEGENCDDLI